MVPIEIKNLKNLKVSKNNIRKFKLGECDYKLCNIFLPTLGHVIFFSDFSSFGIATKMVILKILPTLQIFPCNFYKCTN